MLAQLSTSKCILLALAAVSLVGAVTAGVYALELGLFFHGTPGGGLFPLIAAVGLGVSTLTWAIQVVLAQEALDAVDIPNRTSAQLVGLQAVLLVVFLGLYALIGFAAAASVLAIGTARLAGARRMVLTGVFLVAFVLLAQQGVRLTGSVL